MIFFTFLCQILRISGSQTINKTIYLIEGEDYKVNLDSIFKEDQENIYSFKSNDNGFTLDTSSLKMKSDLSYHQLPTKILRERQLISIEDNQGQGQFGILDKYDLGTRICYNIINLDQCIELNKTFNSYDFVFIDTNTIAVSMVRDQQFGVTIFKNKEIISELYFSPSKNYTQVNQTIIEYCVFEQQKYLLIGVTEEDSNIEFLEILDNFSIVNTNKVIDQSLMPQNQTIQVYDIKGTLNKVYVVCKASDQAKLITSLIFQTKWILQESFISQEFRGIELGYNFIKKSVTQTYLDLQQDKYKISSNIYDSISNKYISISNNLYKIIKPTAQVRYTLNYLIVLQDNIIMVTTLQKSAQRTNIIEGTLLKIDVDFQNDVLIVFTNRKIVKYYLKQATLSYKSNKITHIDLVTIQAQSVQNEQIANIHFQVLSKLDFKLYLIKDSTKDLYYNLLFNSTKFSIPLYEISGPDIMVDGKVDGQVQIIPKQQYKYEIRTDERLNRNIILELLITSNNNYYTYLFRQFKDFRYLICECDVQRNSYYSCCQLEKYSNSGQQQNVSVQYYQAADQKMNIALLNSDGLEINIVQMYYGLTQIKTSQDNKFVDMKVGTDRLFVYTINYLIQFYYFPSGEFINQFNLSQYGQPQGEQIRKLWVNQVKTNLLIITYGEDLIIGRFTTQFIFMQSITIKWVIDVNIVSDNQFTVLSTDKTNKKLTQYIIEEGLIRIQRELDTHGYIITGDNILSDYVSGVIMIEAQKGSQRAILVFADSELERDSLLKVIQLQDDEFPANVIYNQQSSILLIRSTASEKKSSIRVLNYTHQAFETNLTSIPNKLSQKLNLKYEFENSFTKNKADQIEINKHFYLEYQFYNITVKQTSKITYENEDQLIIPIKPDTFQGQIRMIAGTTYDTNVQLTTRFKNRKQVHAPSVFQCKQVFQFEKIICLMGKQVIYLNINGEIISKLKITISEFATLNEIILHHDNQFALIRSDEGELLLIYISENQIQESQKLYQGWWSPMHISIFYKEWLVLCNETQISYFQFKVQENDLWQLEKQNETLIQGIKALQYDPMTEQIFYSIGDQNLYYFKSSLEGNTINRELEYSFNLELFLLSLNIYQFNLTIQNIKIMTYIFVSTSYGNLWNMTINAFTQDFSINNMYVVNGPYPIVEDIQIIDDYVLVQNYKFQCLYKNTHDWQLNNPYLSLEGIFGQKFMGLFKNGSQIIHFYIYYNQELYQNNIDEKMYLTVNNLTIAQDNVSIAAYNLYNSVQVNYQLVKGDKIQKQLFYIVLAVIFLIAIGFYCYKKNQRQQVEEPQLVDFLEDVDHLNNIEITNI